MVAVGACYSLTLWQRRRAGNEQLKKMTKRIVSDKPEPPFDRAAKKAQLEERATEGAKAMTDYKAERAGPPLESATAGQRGGRHQKEKEVAFRQPTGCV